ncbi:hypothetical protein NliqN6_3456 [Naganishia liquefaciens]|uniref:Transcription factor Pcc1 n=1 Tax=Naganishia liquefaciens TaxID=104408 RepID=A0A8H3YF00_9TREE|nr:hypothetical protein NliqN6_3456 [Naganishia liquefaciens]
MTSTQEPAQDNQQDWHQTTLRIPFKSAAHADIARRVILVDRELNAHLVERSIVVEGSNLVATYRTATVRLLRLATNGFIENLQLVIRTIHEFAPTAMESQTADERVTGAAIENGITV